MFANNELMFITNMMYMKEIFNLYNYPFFLIIETNSFIGRSSVQMILGFTFLHF